ncbi:MAG TPA: hypothetical protein VEK79_01305 [Thermoanaerobaculia bacterium]|nr:hypothetical protein [Thermoanaerobaculia bacterium]
MLSLFRRHLRTCPSREKGRAWKRCGCPIWMGGSIGNEKVPRRSLNLTSWEAAENLLAEMKKAGSTQVVAVVKPKTIEEAVKVFLADAEFRNLAESSLRIYRRFIGRQLPAWCTHKGFQYVKQLTYEELADFKASWKMQPATAAKRLERSLGEGVREALLRVGEGAASAAHGACAHDVAETGAKAQSSIVGGAVAPFFAPRHWRILARDMDYQRLTRTYLDSHSGR